MATNYGGGPFACGVIDKHFSRFLIGQDPFNIELIWDQMYRSTMPYGIGGVTAMAMSGVDLALWDLMGKALGQPVYRLAGGKTKESIPCYITTHPDCVQPWKDRGFLGVKIAAPWGAADGRDGLNKMQKCVEQTRADARQRHGDYDRLLHVVGHGVFLAAGAACARVRRQMV